LPATLPEHPLCKLAREMGLWLWSEDRSNAKPGIDARRIRIRHWLSDSPHNRSDVQGNRHTVDNAVADILRQVAEKDAADPECFIKFEVQPTKPI
jgi:hypothetical protein